MVKENGDKLTENKTDERLTDDFDPTAPETFDSAHETYKELRQKCPVAHSNKFNGFWALLKYEDVVNVLKDSKTYITSVQNVVPKVAFTGRRPPLHFDPPEHTPYRRALNPFFTAEKMKQIEPTVRRLTVSLLQPFVEKGGGDVCAEFSYRLPGYVFAEFFNVSEEIAMAIRDVTSVYSRALQVADDEVVKRCSLQLYEIALEIIETRKAEPLDPKDDPTSALLAAEYEGKPLPEEMVLGTIRQLLVVGMIAPSVFIGCVCVHLAQHRDVYQMLQNDLSLVPAAVEEYLRLYTPYKGFARTANRDVEIKGRQIKKDEPVALVYASVNRDEEVFPDGDEFILNRPNIKQHIAFGMGPHNCVGAPLARVMLRVTLEEILKRTKKLELNGEVTMTRFPEHGTISVPLKVIPA